MMSLKLLLLSFLTLALPAQTITHFPATLQSGSPILFRVDLQQATIITGTWLTHPVTFTRATSTSPWLLLAGADVEQLPGSYTIELTATLADHSTRHLTGQIPIGKASYRTSTIQVADKFLAPDLETRARIAADKLVKDVAFARNTPEPLWSGPFAPPVPLSATDSFGTRRTFNGTLASVHRGTDFRAAAGTPVHAANDGVVAIAQPMFYEGGFVLVDHGLGFQTMYMHFSRIDVQAGQTVKKGQRLGLSGATGRVTGPHLHFAARWQGTYLDPVKLLALPLPTH